MDSKIKELFADVTSLLNQLTEKLRPVSPDHWLCKSDWVVSEIEVDDIGISFVEGGHAEYEYIDPCYLTESGMQTFVDNEIKTLEARKAYISKAYEKAKLKRAEMYEELKKEFG